MKRLKPGDVENASARRRYISTDVADRCGQRNWGSAPYESRSCTARVTTSQHRHKRSSSTLSTGERGSRPDRSRSAFRPSHRGREDAMIVNNNAAAVLLVLAALAEGRDVPVSRGESVEIGGSFRVPRSDRSSRAAALSTSALRIERACPITSERSLVPGIDVAMVMKVHPSNYRVDGFIEETSIAELSTLNVPLMADIGSGLLDAKVPWLKGAPPTWLADEPAAVQAISDGAGHHHVLRRQAARRTTVWDHRRSSRPRGAVQTPPACASSAAWRTGFCDRFRTRHSRILTSARLSTSRSGRW